MASSVLLLELHPVSHDSRPSISAVSPHCVKAWELCLAAAQPAKHWITQRAASRVAKDALVFDINETTLSDLDGGYAERTFHQPNPFYLVP